MISQELRDWVRKRNKEDLKDWIAKKYKDEYKHEDEDENGDWYYRYNDDNYTPPNYEIYEWLRTRFSKDYEYDVKYKKPWNSQPVEFEEWLMEIHFEEWTRETRYNQDRKLRYSEEYQSIKIEYKEIIELEKQIDLEKSKLDSFPNYSDDYGRQSTKVSQLTKELRYIRSESKKHAKGSSETEVLRFIRQQQYTSLQGELLPQRRESLPLQRKPFHCDPVLYALLIHTNDLSIPRFAFPIHLKILVKGSVICGQLISKYTYNCLVSENLSIIDNFLNCYFNREVSYYSEVPGELYLHLDTDGYKDIDADPVFRYLRISIHEVDGFSICQFNSLSEDP